MINRSTLSRSRLGSGFRAAIVRERSQVSAMNSTKRAGAPVEGGLSRVAYHGTDPSANYDACERSSIQSSAHSTGHGNIPISIRIGSYETPRDATVPVKR